MKSSNRTYFPGFALDNRSFSRLDPDADNNTIELVNEARDLNDRIEKLDGELTHKSIGIGYSMGSRLLVSAAIAQPDLFAGLVLICPNLGITDENERNQRREKDRNLIEIFRSNIDAGFDQLDSAPVFETDSITQNLLSQFRIRDVSILNKQVEILGLGNFSPLEESLNYLRIPVLFVTGARDMKYVELARNYKKQTAFSHHFVLDSDHRVPFGAPRNLGLVIDWFDNNVVNR